MIENRTGDIFIESVDLIIHQCNLYNTFGSGLAAEIKKRLPWAYEADQKTTKGALAKLGTYEITSSVKMCGGPHFRPVINAYCQEGISAKHRTTNYAAMGKIFFDLNKQLVAEQEGDARTTILGIPYKIGCGLAGGDWKIVEALIYSAFEKSTLEVVIVKLP